MKERCKEQKKNRNSKQVLKKKKLDHIYQYFENKRAKVLIQRMNNMELKNKSLALLRKITKFYCKQNLLVVRTTKKLGFSQKKVKKINLNISLVNL